MTPSQQVLVRKTLRYVAILSGLAILGLLLYGFQRMVSLDRSFRWMLSGLFDPDDAGLIFYTLVLITIGSLWIRAFMGARESDEKI